MSMHRFSLLAALALPSLLPAQNPAIMLTGYWPPSNEAVRQFSPDPVQNPGGWQGANWEGRGYDIYAYFPEFSPPTCTSCGTGTGDLEVDYQDTFADFFTLANAIQPIAIITHSRTNALISWELEMNQYNRSTWTNDYVAPTQPTPSPPDPTVPAGTLRLTTLPVQQIVNDINTAGLQVNPNICFSQSAGGFLSGFIAYLGVWYQDMHRSPTDPAWCVSAGHIHIGRSVPWPLAQQASEVTLRTLIAHVDGIRAANVCQADLGFQGPGTAELAICGQQLNAPGNFADLRVDGAPANALGLLVLGAQNNPTPVFGGTAVPVPFFFADVLLFDAQGGAFVEDYFEGLANGSEVFAQAAYLDPSLPQGWGLSNALRIELN